MKLLINFKTPIFDENKIINFSTKYIYEINIYENKIIGGDIFDEINIDDIIIKKETEPINSLLTINKKEKYKIKNGEINENLIKRHKIKKIIEKKKDETIIKYIISKIGLNSFNSIYDIKLLIYHLSNISIENQNLYNKKDPNLFYTYSNNITNELLDINLQNVLNIPNIKYYNNIPIDLDLTNNRINYTLYTYEKNKYINDIIINNELELDLISLDGFILDKTFLYNEIEKDGELLLILYKGFIEKYYPYYDTNLFMLFLLNENKILEYPTLNIKSNNIITKIENLSNITLKEINKNNNLFTSFYKKLIYHIPSFNNYKTLNLKELFNNIQLNKFKNLKRIELQLDNYYNLVYFSKENILDEGLNILVDINETKSKELYINDKTKNSLINSIYLNKNIIFFIYNLYDKENNINKEIYIIFDEYFNIYVIYNLYEYSKLLDTTRNIRLDDYKEIVNKLLNDLLNDLYDLKIINKKKIINKINMELKLIDKQIIINQNTSINDFNKLYNNILNLELLDYYQIHNYDMSNNIIELFIKKIKYQNIFNNQLSILSNNYYNFYTKYELIEKYNNLLYSSNIRISNRIKDIKIEILNINKDDLFEFENILKYLINISLEINNKNKSQINKESINKNKLKRLKEIDPILYAINKKNTNNLYSRKCQASQQPDIIDKKDINKTKNHIKYINFTTGEPIYYTCNNKKFPNVKFLTNLHPQNYCIPCCKKKAIEDVKIKSKYISIHNECLTTYKYDKKNKQIDEKSRYIMNYSSKIIIENLRLMQIPDSLFKLFNKTFEDINSKEDLKYYILGLNQNYGNKSNIGILSVISFILNKSIDDTINYIKNLFIADPNFINIIYDGKLLYHFSSTKDFLIIFTNIFQDKILLSNLSFEFNEWNELFIDICKYLGYISIIFEESENDDSLNLIIPPNIKYANEYIYNNNSFQYLILLQRINKNKKLYYPVIKTNYNDYYNANYILNKFYSYDNQIIKLISQIITNNLQILNNSLNLSTIEEFIMESKNYNIETYFINTKQEIYSILLSYNLNKSKNFIYLNIQKQKIKDINNNINTKIDKNYSLEYININKYKIDLNSIVNFIKTYNNFIYSKNKQYYTELYYKSIVNTININDGTINESLILSNDIIKNLYSYIYISKFLIYKNKIIGVQLSINNNNYNSYISKLIEKNIGKKILSTKFIEIEKILKNKNIQKEVIIKLLTREFKQNKYLEIDYLYNPHEINNKIYNKKIIIDDRIKKRNESLYYTNLYNLFLLHFTDKLYKLKNNIIRSKLKHLINNFTPKDIQLILSNQYTNLKDLIIKNIKINDDILLYKILYNITDFIKHILLKHINQTISITWLSKIKKIIIENIDDTIFLFDNILIYNILDLNKTDAIKELHKILDTIIINTKLPINNNDSEISLELCEQSNNSYMCKDNKLIISKIIYNQLIDILYYDLMNPFKQKLILNLVNYNLNNIYNFKQFINEKIYIYI